MDEVGAALRAVIDRFVVCDHHPEELAQALSILGQLELVLDGPQRGTFLEDVSTGSQAWQAYLDQSPFGGGWNPLGPPMEVAEPGTTTGLNRLTATVVLGRAYEGGPGLAHGGFIAGLFDHVLGLAQGRTLDGMATVSLTVRYRRPTPLWKRLTLTAWYDDVEVDSRVVGRATCHVDGRVTADAEGVFHRIGFDELAQRALV